MDCKKDDEDSIYPLQKNDKVLKQEVESLMINIKENEIASLDKEIDKLEKKLRDEKRYKKKMTSLYNKLKKVPFSFALLFLLLFWNNGFMFSQSVFFGVILSTPLIIISEIILKATYKNNMAKKDIIKKYEKQKYFLTNLKDELNADLENIKNNNYEGKKPQLSPGIKTSLIKLYIEYEKKLREYNKKGVLKKYVDATDYELDYLKQLMVIDDNSNLCYTDEDNKKIAKIKHINIKNRN